MFWVAVHSTLASHSPDNHIGLGLVDAIRATSTCCLAINTTWHTDGHWLILPFLQRVSIACYAKRCTSYRKSVCLSVYTSVRLSVTVWHCVKTTKARIMGSSLEDSPMTLVSSCLTAARNSKGNLRSEATEWERGGKSRQFLANKSPYLGNGAR